MKNIRGFRLNKFQGNTSHFREITFIVQSVLAGGDLINPQAALTIRRNRRPLFKFRQKKTNGKIKADLCWNIF